jgi:hypothetical protein
MIELLTIAVCIGGTVLSICAGFYMGRYVKHDRTGTGPVFPIITKKDVVEESDDDENELVTNDTAWNRGIRL